MTNQKKVGKVSESSFKNYNSTFVKLKTFFLKKDINKLIRLKWQGERNLFKQAEKIFNEMIKDIKSFGIDQKIEVLSKVLKEKIEIIQEINKIQKFKSSVISNSRDSNLEKQESFKNLQEQFKEKIENA